MTRFLDKSFSVHAGTGDEYRDRWEQTFGKRSAEDPNLYEPDRAKRCNDVARNGDAFDACNQTAGHGGEWHGRWSRTGIVIKRWPCSASARRDGPHSVADVSDSAKWARDFLARAEQLAEDRPDFASVLYPELRARLRRASDSLALAPDGRSWADAKPEQSFDEAEDEAHAILDETERKRAASPEQKEKDRPGCFNPDCPCCKPTSPG